MNTYTLIKFLEKNNFSKKILRYIADRLTAYYASKDELSREALAAVRQIKKETEMALLNQEAILIYKTVKKVSKIKGDIAEVGVYKGGSAKLIAKATKKPIHLFDTFEGLPNLHKKDNPKQFQKGDYSAQLEKVKKYLSHYSQITFYRGVFPLTAKPVRNKKFSFVHLDVDIYESTLNSLNFFYSPMSKGGVIVSHDYSSSDGVKKAFNEFFKGKPKIIIEPYTTSQAFIVKV